MYVYLRYELSLRMNLRLRQVKKELNLTREEFLLLRQVAVPHAIPTDLHEVQCEIASRHRGRVHFFVHAAYLRTT